ncbi:MAG: branched-chain amino acid transaminase [Thaumarchaeota archaeon]|nr:branched-chain amino acid transaminase [Nitrososphaerota archaeon]
MKESGKIWMNGMLVPFADAKVHVLTHALHYSTSVFEGIRCYSTPEGPAIFRLDDHVDRMFRSAKMYSMKIRYTKGQIAGAIIDTVRACRLKECYIRPLAYYGYGEMGLTPTKNSVDVSISCWPWKMGESKAGKFSGARCMVSSWTRIDPRAQPVQAKAAANYSNAALARVEALENGYDEAIMLSGDGRVAEGSAENIFICTDGRILTPPLSTGCLSGITRDSVIKIAAADGIDISEYDLYRADLYTADEIFMTGTAAEVKSVTQVDRTRIGSGRMGRVTKALQKSFVGAAMGKDKRFRQWLTFI